MLKHASCTHASCTFPVSKRICGFFPPSKCGNSSSRDTRISELQLPFCKRETCSPDRIKQINQWYDEGDVFPEMCEGDLLLNNTVTKSSHIDSFSLPRELPSA